MKCLLFFWLGPLFVNYTSFNITTTISNDCLPRCYNKIDTKALKCLCVIFQIGVKNEILIKIYKVSKTASAFKCLN